MNPARALHQDNVAGRDQGLAELARRFGVGEKSCLRRRNSPFDGPFHEKLCVALHGDHPRHAAWRALAAHAPVQLRRRRPQLQHLTRHHDAAARPRPRGKRLKHALHGQGIGVVAIVDDRNLTRECKNFTPLV